MRSGTVVCVGVCACVLLCALHMRIAFYVPVKCLRCAGLGCVKVLNTSRFLIVDAPPLTSIATFLHNDVGTRVCARCWGLGDGFCTFLVTVMCEFLVTMWHVFIDSLQGITVNCSA